MFELVVYSQVTIHKAGYFKKKETLYKLTKYHMIMQSEQVCKGTLPVSFLNLTNAPYAQFYSLVHIICLCDTLLLSNKFLKMFNYF